MRGQRFTFGPFLLNLNNRTLLRKGEHAAIGRRGVLLLVARARQDQHPTIAANGRSPFGTFERSSRREQRG
jgi:hypothetical protein